MHYIAGTHYIAKALNESASNDSSSEEICPFFVPFGCLTRDGELYRAALDNNIELAEYLVSHGAHITGDHLCTALRSEKGLAVALFLISKGAPLVPRDPTKSLSPLHVIVQSESKSALECVARLLDRGADINSVEGCFSPLMRATIFGDPDIALLLIARGACLKDYTPLYWAARRGLVTVLRALLAQGVDITVETHYGWMALDLAIENGHAEAIELLKKAQEDALRVKEENSRKEQDKAELEQLRKQAREQKAREALGLQPMELNHTEKMVAFIQQLKLSKQKKKQECESSEPHTEELSRRSQDSHSSRSGASV